jgi:hypothetical protein
MHSTMRRTMTLGGALALVSLWLAWAVGLAADDSMSSDPGIALDAPVIGRYSVVSDAGGAVWAFQPGGELIVVGPGELLAEGTWAPGPEAGDFDAELDVDVAGQALSILGAVSPDGSQIALYVVASEATSPLDGIAWPPVSRLVGDRVGLVPDPTPDPSPPPSDCLRPAWGAAESVDWDRCSVTAQESLPPAG